MAYINTQKCIKYNEISKAKSFLRHMWTNTTNKKYQDVGIFSMALNIDFLS